MKVFSRILVFSIICVLSFGAPADVQVTNGVYTASITNAADVFSLGSWNAATGALHPTGAGNDLMYQEFGGNFTESTNFSSLRSYTSGIDYTFAGSGSGVNLDPFFTGEGPSGLAPPGQGWFTAWDVTPEGLRINQDVLISGSTFADSAIYHTVVLENYGPDPILVGWRNLYDWAVDEASFDDGPNNAVETTSGVVVPATTIPFSHVPASDEFVRVSADPQVPTYEPLLGIGFDPGFIPGLPATMPEEYAYIRWSPAFSSAFDYTPGVLDATNDSAGLSWFGRTQATAIEIQPGESVRLTQVVFGVIPDEPPPGGDSLSKELTSGPDRDGSLWLEDFSDISGLTLNGDAAQAGSALRLTPAIQGQVGSAFTTNPVTLGPAASFSTHFSFQISGSANGGADGLAFLVQNDVAADNALGGGGGNMGYSGITPSLAVEFDSWSNGIGLGDVDGNHVGTATNGGVGNGIAVPLATQLDGGSVFFAWVDYDGLADMLEVRVDTVNVRPAAPTLSQAGIGLEALLGGTSAYVGFTSGTGFAVGNHDILSWHLSSAIDLVVPVGELVPTAYDFTITSEGQPVWVYDSVPAEWDVTDVEGEFEGVPEDLPLDCGEATSFTGIFGMVDVSRGGKAGKKCNSDTAIWWMPGEDNTLNVQTEARCHDNKRNKKCRPTSCGALYLNYGAIAYQKDPDTGEIVLDDENNPIVVAGPTDPICLAAVEDVNDDGIFTWDGSGDEDGDNLTDLEEACTIGTDPCLEDTDGDGINDDVDECPLEGPADPALGEILEPSGCIRQSQCSDGIDNDGDTFVDFPNDAGCDDILDDIEEGVCLEAFDCSDPDSELIECGNGGDCACFQNVDGPSVCVDATTPCAGLTECVDGNDCAFDEACVPASCCDVQVCVNSSMCLDSSAQAVNFSFEGQGPTLGRQ